MSSSAAPLPTDPPPLTGLRLFFAAMLVSLGVFLVMLDLTVANVSVPHIAGSLGASTTQGTWIITSYAVAEAICLPLTGWLAKRFGAVRVFVTGLLGFMLASALCGMSTTLTMLIVARVAQGLCGAPLLPLCQTLLLRIFPKDKAGMAIATSAMTAIIAPITGPIIGGYITDNYSWNWIFYLNVPFVLISAPLVYRILAPYETARTIQRVDFVGLFLLLVWVGALQITLDLGRDHDWFASPTIVGLSLVAFIGFLAFLIWELTDHAPIVDLRLLRYRGLWTSTLCLAVGFAALMSGGTLIPLWAQTTLGYTATLAGFVMAPLSIFSLFCIPLAGKFANRIDTRVMICWGMCWLGIVAMLRSGTTPDMTIYHIALPQLLQGLSTAFYMVGLTVIALGSVKPAEVAAAAGLMAFLRTIATAFAISGTTTYWEHETRVARSELTGIMNGADMTVSGLIARGMTDTQARALLERGLEVQSSTIAFNHVFAMVGLLSIIAAQLVWIIPKPRRVAH